MRFLTAVALVMLWVPVDGVAQERGDPLRGITTVLPVVDLLMDEAVSPEVKEKYDQEIEDAFELGLLRAGLELTPRRGRTGIPPLLICDAMALPASGRTSGSIGSKRHEGTRCPTVLPRYHGRLS